MEERIAKVNVKAPANMCHLEESPQDAAGRRLCGRDSLRAGDSRLRRGQPLPPGTATCVEDNPTQGTAPHAEGSLSRRRQLLRREQPLRRGQPLVPGTASYAEGNPYRRGQPPTLRAAPTAGDSPSRQRQLLLRRGQAPRRGQPLRRGQPPTAEGGPHHVLGMVFAQGIYIWDFAWSGKFYAWTYGGRGNRLTPAGRGATAQGIGGARSGPGTGRNPRKARFSAQPKMRPNF
jgi:hypothetical protein